MIASRLAATRRGALEETMTTVRRGMLFRFSLAAMLCCPAVAPGQPKAAGDTNLRTHPQVIAAFRELEEKGTLFTVRVQSAGKDAALGTIVGPDGWIITKASEVKGKPKLT